MEWIEAIEDQSAVDIEINQTELEVINKIREQFNDFIIHEGWFDVNTLGYSY